MRNGGCGIVVQYTVRLYLVQEPVAVLFQIAGLVDNDPVARRGGQQAVAVAVPAGLRTVAESVISEDDRRLAGAGDSSQLIFFVIRVTIGDHRAVEARTFGLDRSSQSLRRSLHSCPAG